MSMINKHNYEEWFLLYADDELNHQQRAAVELFVQQNPGMGAELETFMQMKLQPEEGIVFPGKQSLYKTSDVDININNYGAFFLFYIDRELDETAREKVEKFVLQHPQLQDEFTLLKQTVLQPEAIVFGDKSSLYRKEEGRRIYPLYLRFAAAAALIGIAVLGWWLYPAGTTHPGVHPVADHSIKTKPVTTQTLPQATDKIQPVAPVQHDIQQSTAVVNKKQPKQNKAVTPVPVVNEAPAQHTVNNSDLADNDNTKGNKDEHIAPLQPLPVIKETDPTLANAGNALVNEIKPPTVIDTDGDRDRDKTNTVYTQVAYNVPYKVLDTNDDEDRSVYVGSLELNKDKIRGFLKRAGRLFGSKAKKDTD